MADLLNDLRKPWTDATHSQALMMSASDEIERLRALVSIGDVRCEQCGSPATTLDMSGLASCADCIAKNDLNNLEPKSDG